MRKQREAFDASSVTHGCVSVCFYGDPLNRSQGNINPSVCLNVLSVFECSLETALNPFPVMCETTTCAIIKAMLGGQNVSENSRICIPRNTYWGFWCSPGTRQTPNTCDFAFLIRQCVYRSQFSFFKKGIVLLLSQTNPKTLFALFWLSWSQTKIFLKPSILNPWFINLQNL